MSTPADDAPATSPDQHAPALRADVASRITADVAALGASAAQGLARPVAARVTELEALRRGIRSRRRDLQRALAADLGKSATESSVTEIGPVLAEIQTAVKNLRSWTRPERFSPGALLAPARGSIVREPLGTALIIAPWNYPVNLTLSPLVAAIAGGNTVLLKPSELAPATSHVIRSLIEEHLDPAWVRVVEGAVEETTHLLAERFDIIFYTGNATVGRIVARAAAEHLTPTVLELGGKSPVFVDEGTDLATAARRIVWGKFTNAGQTCVAPDYLMATPATLEALVPELREAVREMYGRNPMRSADYGRIVSERHFDRLRSLVDDDLAVVGGTAGADRRQRYLAPTILAGASWDHPVMAEEIFGPILPLLPVEGPAEAIARINAGEKPLTAYVFSPSHEVEERFAEQTSSGSLALGLTLAHLGTTAMPFGGVGESGHGAYHGKAGFEAFTHAKPIVRKPLRPDTLRTIYPPYRAPRRRILGRLFR